MLGGLCLVRLDGDTGLPVLLVAYLLLGAGVGFANAPITNTAVSSLPSAQAGVAGGVTSTARQFGAALGVAIAGGIVGNTAPAGLAHATRPGWLLVAGCGLLLALVARASPGRARHAVGG
jgi:predicted MFS family arabinose efflux permease